jgi:glycerophosphoryl diester phosphodiesterase
VSAHGFVREKGARPLVYGHRGTRLGAPENTLRAMQRAVDQGADGIELDVRLCGSGEVIVLHDADLKRVAGVPIAVTAATLADLRGIDVGEGERVPLLDDAMALVLAAGRLLNIELKPDVPNPQALVERVAARVLARPAAEHEAIVVSSFSARMCRALAAALPRVAIGFLFDHAPDELPAGIAAVHPHQALADAEAISRCRAQGLAVNVWTVNDPERARALASAGADGLITDDVPLVLGALGGVASR